MMGVIIAILVGIFGLAVHHISWREGYDTACKEILEAMQKMDREEKS